MTCLMGLAVGTLAAFLGALSSALAVCTRGPKKLCDSAINARTTRAFCWTVPAEFLNGLIIVPLRLKDKDPKGRSGCGVLCLTMNERGPWPEPPGAMPGHKPEIGENPSEDEVEYGTDQARRRKDTQTTSSPPGPVKGE